MATGPETDAQPEVLRALVGAGEELKSVLTSSCWSMTDDEARSALLEVSRLQSMAHAAYLRLLAESARRDAPLPGTDADRPAAAGTAETCAWLSAERRLSVGRVRTDLREARALDPDTGDLRGLGHQLATGAVTAEHTGVAVRALNGVPTRIRGERQDDLDATLTRHALTFTPPTARDLARHLLDTIEPDRARHRDEDADLRREVYVATDSTGMLVVRGQLEPAGGALVKAVVDHLAAPQNGPVTTPSCDDGLRDGATQGVLQIRDPRTPAQRRHDALVEMARLAAASIDAGTRAGEPARVVVHTTAAQLAAGRNGGDRRSEGDAACEDGVDSTVLTAPGSAVCEQTGPLSPTTLARIACDAVIDRILLSAGGRVLSMSTLGRLFTPAQRRALAARDGGCAFPGCDRPAAWTDAHHVVFWSEGGPTTVENGVLLCGPHHTTIHRGAWTVTMCDGLPWFVPPAHLDPLQRPVRNHHHAARQDTRRVGQQLALGLPLDAGPPGPPPPPDVSAVAGPDAWEGCHDGGHDRDG